MINNFIIEDRKKDGVRNLSKAGQQPLGGKKSTVSGE